jgi:PAS domain-containing protein
VVAVLDRTSQELRFNRALLGVTLDNITQAISVVDEDMRLVAWNRPYLELFGYPEGMVYVGCPVADLIRYNAERGECGPGEVDEHVRKRITHMRKGSPHVFERVRTDGRVDRDARHAPARRRLSRPRSPMSPPTSAPKKPCATPTKRWRHASHHRTEELARALDAQRRPSRRPKTPT